MIKKIDCAICRLLPNSLDYEECDTCPYSFSGVWEMICDEMVSTQKREAADENKKRIRKQ